MSKHQETEGLLSPMVRDIRLSQIARRIAPGSKVLDLACGNGHLFDHLPPGCTYFGVDRLPPDGRPELNILMADLLDPLAPENVKSWVGGKVDYIACAAFLEHVRFPTAVVTAFRTLLSPKGAFIGTTPHPRGRYLHDNLARLYLCSRSGAAEHETFLSSDDLREIARASGGKLAECRQFLLGLNQVFTFRYSD